MELRDALQESADLFHGESMELMDLCNIHIYNDPEHQTICKKTRKYKVIM